LNFSISNYTVNKILQGKGPSIKATQLKIDFANQKDFLRGTVLVPRISFLDKAGNEITAIESFAGLAPGDSLTIEGINMGMTVNVSPN
jgi:hypothetical protein